MISGKSSSNLSINPGSALARPHLSVGDRHQDEGAQLVSAHSAPMSTDQSGNWLALPQRQFGIGSRFLIVGDVHGQFDMLQRVLAAAEYDEHLDVLIGVGDLIDRGPQSVEVVRFFSSSARRFCTMGNHEAYLLEAGGVPTDAHAWCANGGDWAMWAEPQDIAYCYKALSEFPISIELFVDQPALRIGIIHAEVPEGLSWADIYRLRVDRDDFRSMASLPVDEWLRGRHRIKSAALAQAFLDEPNGAFPFGTDVVNTPGIDLVISGHSILNLRRPFRSGNHLWIDTGAFEHKYGGRLTVVDPTAEVYWQASSKESFGPLSLRDESIWRLK